MSLVQKASHAENQPEATTAHPKRDVHGHEKCFHLKALKKLGQFTRKLKGSGLELHILGQFVRLTNQNLIIRFMHHASTNI